MGEPEAILRHCSYQSLIRGGYLLVFRVYFPMAEMLSPPEGWQFLRVSQWRKGCPDECWRIVYNRPTPPPEGKE